MNGEVWYSLSARTETVYGHQFSVDSRSGVISQLEPQWLEPIDFEQLHGTDPISLLVVASDGGTHTNLFIYCSFKLFSNHLSNAMKNRQLFKCC